MSFIIPQQPWWIRETGRGDRSHNDRHRAPAIRSLSIYIFRILCILGVSSTPYIFYYPQDGENEQDQADYGPERDA